MWRMRRSILVNLSNVVGILPESVLIANCKNFISFKSPRELGIVPKRDVHDGLNSIDSLPAQVPVHTDLPYSSLLASDN
jgi:hypothetical protein